MSTAIESNSLRRTLSNLAPSIEIGAAALASLLLLAIAQGATVDRAATPAGGNVALAMTVTGGHGDTSVNLASHGLRRSGTHRALRQTSLAALSGPRRAQGALSPIRALFSSCGSADRSNRACGSAQVERPTIQAQLVYRRTLISCPAVDAVMIQGGLQNAIGLAVRNAEDQSLRTGASEPATENLINKAVQSALIASGAKPKDALAAVESVQGAFRDCGGDRAAAAVLAGTASVIRAQLNYDTPAAIGGPGIAPIADPRLPSPGNLGTASYSSVTTGG
jgi:hypothetical protein